MDLNNFVKLIADQFEEEDIDKVDVNCIFSKIDSYDSLTRMSIISSIEDETGVIITLKELEGISSIKELFSLVESRI